VCVCARGGGDVEGPHSTSNQTNAELAHTHPTPKPQQDLIAEDTQRIGELELAHAAARAAAIDALLSLPPGTTAAKSRAGAQRGGSAASCEIEPVECDGGAAAAGAKPKGAGVGVGGAKDDGDDEFADLKKKGAKGVGRATRAMTAAEGAAAVEGEELAGESDEPLWKRQMRQAAKDTFHRVRFEGGVVARLGTPFWGGKAR